MIVVSTLHDRFQQLLLIVEEVLCFNSVVAVVDRGAGMAHTLIIAILSMIIIVIIIIVPAALMTIAAAAAHHDIATAITCCASTVYRQY
jgi:hypothetical protein